MDRNDRFARQNGEDASAHFARLARELWGCVDELKRVAVPALEKRLDSMERQLERARYEHERDVAVRIEEEKATQSWREDTRKRLQRVEDQVDAIRVSAGLSSKKSSILEIDFKTLFIIATAVGAVIYEILRRSTGQ